jgi:hypothetical protein
MSCFFQHRWLLAFSLLCSLPLLGFAATIYKTVDENGVVTYSDTKPADDIVVETLIIDVQESPGNDQAQQRLQEMRDTTDRMASDRMAREKHRAQLRELEAQAEAQRVAQDVPDYYDNSTIYTGYYDYPVRRPWRPPYHHRPDHPIAHPPLLPPAVRPQPRYDYPASYIRNRYPDPKVRKAFE